MKILIIGAGEKVPTFISRRIKAYKKKDISLIIQQYEKNVNEQVLIEGKLRKGYFRFINVILKDVFRFITGFFIVIRYSPRKNFLYNFLWAADHYQYAHIKPDIIHIQWIGSAKNYEWLKKLYKVPLISSARGRQVTAYPFQNKNYLKNIQESFQISDKVHCVSNDIKKACIKLGCKESKLFVNYNGLDTDYFIPDIKTSKETVPVVLSIGYMVWNKCFPYQLLIAQQLLSSCNYRHIIIGAGKEFDTVKYLAHQLNILNKVEFKGHLPEKEILHNLQKADIYLSTSMAEGLSNSVMEAASCGLPVVAFDCEGMKEIIINSKTGFVIPRGDINQYIAKVKQLLTDEELRAEMGYAARIHIEKHFKAEDHVQKMISFYKNII